MKCMLRLAPLAVDHANTALSAGAYDTVATVPRLSLSVQPSELLSETLASKLR